MSGEGTRRMQTHSVMTPEEYADWAGHPPAGVAMHDTRPYREVRLANCDQRSGVRAVTVRCDPEIAPRVGDWLGRVAERNGWGGTVMSD